ncbi:MAG: Transcriptional regulator, GntR family domain / Aspartate aminotransferase [uncultured Thermomicrobiales bacterium]|uniref:Transcriptional regulator, GntR family domain / Aspartate aminotransferase n=1 Tax=uncultured Thermomicrobiales bacterium TaxID=1645740 RepID=A0A6J4U486_9BACT|nr:MAG: Transcriptional regulator, GntR family domain / Aspartate aminotransferase [uncultured Thermomicrobiales bacterium]
MAVIVAVETPLRRRGRPGAGADGAVTLPAGIRTAAAAPVDGAPVAGSADRPEPRYRRLADALAAAIGRGELPEAARLPSERDLALALGVSRTTAVAAYRELAARGLVRGQVGRGTFVCVGLDRGVADGAASGTGGAPAVSVADAPFAWRGKVALRADPAAGPGLRPLIRAGADAAVVSFAAGAPALDLFPTERFRALTDRILAEEGPAALGLAPIEGVPALRRAIAARAGIDPGRVLVVAGAQQGLDLVARCLVDPGDAVVVDRPGYLGAIHAFRAAGARLVGWDAVRADLDELEDLFLRHRPKLLYTGPTHQNPTGRTLDTVCRRELLALAARYRIPIVEDDPYRELGFPSPRSGGRAGGEGQRVPAVPPTLAALDRDALVIHLGTFAKTLAGGLRLGWVAAAPAIVDHLARLKANTDVSCPGLTQRILATMLVDGGFDAHLVGLRAEHARRHASMVAVLRRHLPPPALTWDPVAGGLYLWARLGDGGDAAALLRLAETRGAGVAFVPGAAFYPDAGVGAGPGRSTLRLCFTAADPPRIDLGVRRLAALLRGHPAPVAAGHVPVA